ncbi:hypothetical protein IP88_04035 [alpha proteobacterium AAP81b]|nr:hypothetical protein IP88_04035 [alpha proteobacterium AAP81b]
MITALGRGIMALAVRWLGEERRDWGLAMEAEFEAAAVAGEPLGFALGCLAAAIRQAPTHEEGRFRMASHLLAMGILLPIGALLLSSVLRGFPFLVLEHGGTAWLPGLGTPELAVNDGNAVGLPLMALLTVASGAGHAGMAWLVLERDWVRVALLGRMAAAQVVTMLIFSGIFFPGDLCAFPQSVLIAVELCAVCTLVRWHDSLPGLAGARRHPGLSSG